MAILRQTVSWTRRPSSRRGFRLTEEEQANVRAALRLLHIRYQGWAAVARAMGVALNTLKNAMGNKQRPGPVMGLRAAKLAGVPYDDLVSGKWPRPGQCPLCGHVDRKR